MILSTFNEALKWMNSVCFCVATAQHFIIIILYFFFFHFYISYPSAFITFIERNAIIFRRYQYPASSRRRIWKSFFSNYQTNIFLFTIEGRKWIPKYWMNIERCFDELYAFVERLHSSKMSAESIQIPLRLFFLLLLFQFNWKVTNNYTSHWIRLRAKQPSFRIQREIFMAQNYITAVCVQSFLLYLCAKIFFVHRKLDDIRSLA